MKLPRSGPVHIGDLADAALAALWDRTCTIRAARGEPPPPAHLNPNRSNERHTMSTNDPILIGAEAVVAAARALGLTETRDILEIRISQADVRITRCVRGEHDDLRYRFDSFELETTESTIPILYDAQASEAIAAAEVRADA